MSRRLFCRVSVAHVVAADHRRRSITIIHSVHIERRHFIPPGLQLNPPLTISTQRQLQQITEQQTANGYLSAIAAQKTQAIELTINMSGEGFQQEVFKQLVEANNQAQGPTVVKLSGVRR